MASPKLQVGFRLPLLVKNKSWSTTNSLISGECGFCNKKFPTGSFSSFKAHLKKCQAMVYQDLIFEPDSPYGSSKRKRKATTIDSEHESQTIKDIPLEDTSILDSYLPTFYTSKHITKNKHLTKFLAEVETQTEPNQEQEEFRKTEVSKLKIDNEKLRSQINGFEAKIEYLNEDMNKKNQSLAAAQTENKEMCSVMKEYEVKLECKDKLLAMKDELILMLKKHQK